MTDEERVREVLNGQTRIWRFTAEEQGGSSDIADRLLWLGILRAEYELAAALFGGVSEGADASTRRTPSPYRFLKDIAQPIPTSFNELVEEIGRYEDRGQESIVCDGGDGFVNKLRPMKPSSLTGYLAPLANIVYHNRMFPRERYTLENIYVFGERYYMGLRQERVDILLDGEGYPVRPTADQIRAAIEKLPVQLVEYVGGEEGGNARRNPLRRVTVVNDCGFITSTITFRIFSLDAIRFLMPRRDGFASLTLELRSMIQPDLIRRFRNTELVAKICPDKCFRC